MVDEAPPPLNRLDESDETEPVELRAQRAAIQARAAEARSRRALSMAADARRNSWTKADQLLYVEKQAVAWGRYRRSVVVMIVVVVLLMVLGAYLLWAAFAGADARTRKVDADFRHFQSLSEQSCEARNVQRDTDAKLYQELADTFALEAPLSPEATSLRAALAGLPAPVDCATYVQGG